jgi:elongation factor 1 alpha-like protein
VNQIGGGGLVMFAICNSSVDGEHRFITIQQYYIQATLLENFPSELEGKKSFPMSRHRNVKQLVEEDYYDNGDDDYDDDYDDYDDGYTGGSTTLTASKSKTTANKVQPSKSSKGGAPKSTAASVKSNVKSPIKATAASTVPSKKAPASTTVAAHPKVSSPPVSTPVVAPPPGFPALNDHAAPEAVSSPENETAANTTALDTPSILLEKYYSGEINEQRRIPLTVVVLGHVDAGKSTITGHLLSGGAPSGGGKNSSRSSSSRSNAAPNFAWILDEDEQERAHGVTMDIATKQLPLSSRYHSKFDIVLQDAPGHADYVPAMITGTAAADVALLCVDATDLHTALAAGQLREHAFLARGLGVNQVLVVFNKMDVVGWDRADAYHAMEAKVLEFLTQQVGYPAARVRCIPLSGLTGTNLFPPPGDVVNYSDETQLLRAWYQGPTLVEALDRFEPPAAQQQHKLLEKPLRIIVSDVVESSASVSLRAKVVSGWVKQGESIVVLPVGDTAILSKFNSLHVSSSDAAVAPLRRQYCAAGEILDCTIAGIDAQRISTGSILTRSHSRPPIAGRCRAKIFLLDRSTNSVTQMPLIRGTQMIFHMHHIDVPCHVAVLIRTLKADGITTLKERPRALPKSCTAIVELQLAVPICLEAFADCRALGRFVLRRNGDSVAVGRVEQLLS